MIELGTTLQPLDALARDPANPREITAEDLDRLKHTLRGRPELLRARPLIADDTGLIIGGYHRHLALEEMTAAGELGPIADEYPDGRYPTFAGEWDEAGRREIMLLDNQPFARWVDDKLAQLVAAHHAAGEDMAMLGFADAELRSLQRIAAKAGGGPGGSGGHGDPEDVPPAPRAPVSRLGDLWELGEHRLLVGDSTRIGEVMRLLEGSPHVDLLITDPPYGVAYQTKLSHEEAVARRRRTDGLEVSGDDLTPAATRELFVAALESVPLKQGGSFYVTVPAGPMQQWFVTGVEEAWPGTPPALRQILAWVKDVFVMGRTDYHYRHEPVLYGWKPGAAHFFVDDRTQDSVWEIPRPKRSEEHPTMKPVELFGRMIENSSRAGDVVYDPFAGSGTTVIACETRDRAARVVELDLAYADVIVRRWEEFSGGTARLHREGEWVNVPELRLVAAAV